MISRKKKTIGGVQYMVHGSTIEYAGFGNISRKSYSTSRGKVIVEGGYVTHPDGTKTKDV